MPHNVRLVNTGQKLTKKILDLLFAILPRCSHDRHLCLLLVSCMLLPAENNARELVTANKTVHPQCRQSGTWCCSMSKPVVHESRRFSFSWRSRWAARSWRLRLTLHAPMTLPEPYTPNVSNHAHRLFLSGLSSGTSTRWMCCSSTQQTTSLTLMNQNAQHTSKSLLMLRSKGASRISGFLLNLSTGLSTSLVSSGATIALNERGKMNRAFQKCLTQNDHMTYFLKAAQLPQPLAEA